MANSVRDWMSSPVVLIAPETTITQALTLMRRRGIHSLVVDLTKGGDPTYGIVTTTDIRDKIVAESMDPSAMTVDQIMTSPVVCARSDWNLRQAAQKMGELGAHHLPVEDERGSLIGMISATDIFIAVEERGWEASL
ncbi:MAG: CBS domain-containing protein [Anaerolineales bacterium]